MSLIGTDGPPTDSARRLGVLRPLGAAVLALIALTGCSAVGETGASGDPAEVFIRDLLDSSVIDESRALNEAALERGATRSGLAAQVDEQFRLGNISGSTACLQTGLAYGLSDDEIVADCHDAYQELLDQMQ